MFNWVLKQILGSKNQRELKRMAPIVRRINELDEQFKSLSDADLRAKTLAWKERLAPVEDPAEREAILNEILPDAFAVVRNGAAACAAKRGWCATNRSPGTWCTSTCSSLAAWSCTRAASRKWPLAKARR